VTVATIVLVVAALVMVVSGVLGLIGRLPPNGVIGIRTRFTRASDANWYAVHRAGAPWLIFGGVAAFVIGTAFLPFMAIGKLSDGGALAVVIVVLVLTMIAAVGAWLFGTWGARRGVLASGVPERGHKRY
jgi:uncharacterized membrane protein